MASNGFLNDKQVNIDGGCILLSRAILDSRLWSVPDGTLKVAVYLLLKANHDKRYFKMVEIQRGQTCRSLNTIAEECFLSIKTVRVALNILQKLEFIKIDKPFGAKQGQRISICNYDTYQNLKNHKGKAGANEGANEGAPNNNYNNYNKYIFNERELGFMNEYFSSEVITSLQVYTNCFFETHQKKLISDRFLISLKHLKEIPEDLRVKSIEKSTGKWDDFYMPGIEFKNKERETDFRPKIEEIEK
jgi:hypothetical protein